MPNLGGGMSLLFLQDHFAASTLELRQSNKRFGGENPLDILLRKINGLPSLSTNSDTINNRIEVAICEFYRAHSQLPKVFRHVCWGLLDESDQHPPIINDSTLFGRVMDEAQNRLENRRLSPSHFRGLLDGYWRYKEHDFPGAHSHWLRLREFLRSSLKEVFRHRKSMHDWAVFLQNHMELLSDHPCDVIAEKALSADEEKITEELRYSLFIPQESWLWDELVFAQIKYVCTQGNETYLELLPRAIELLNHMPLFADDALRRLLIRHENTLREFPHEPLLEFATERWGSPSLYYDAQWELVSGDVKSMISTWLAENDMRDFFSVLRSDSDMDRRRLDFWLNYSQSIMGTRFVLGDRTFYSQEPGIKEIRQKKKERISKMVGSGQYENNAFILYIGNLIFIEFGQKGNAVQIFHKDTVAIRFDQYELSISKDLKHESKIDRLIHQDKKWDTWEDTFASYLRRHGVHPNDKQRKTRQASQPQVSASPQKLSPIHTPFTEDDLWDFTEKHDLTFKDKTKKQGGNLWVHHNNEYDAIAEQLIRFGFRYAEGKGFWRRSN